MPPAKTAIGPLSDALDDADSSVRWNVIRALGQMGPAAAVASSPYDSSPFFGWMTFPLRVVSSSVETRHWFAAAATSMARAAAPTCRIDS